MTVFALVLLVGTDQIQAVLFEEEFHYPVGSELNGQNPGFGGTWTTVSRLEIAERDGDRFLDGLTNNSGGNQPSQFFAHPFSVASHSGVITFTADVLAASSASDVGGVGFALGKGGPPGNIFELAAYAVDENAWVFAGIGGDVTIQDDGSLFDTIVEVKIVIDKSNPFMPTVTRSIGGQLVPSDPTVVDLARINALDHIGGQMDYRFSGIEVHNIRVVPEPSTAILAGAGCLALVLRRRRSR